jgi:hypothetical protein
MSYNAFELGLVNDAGQQQKQDTNAIGVFVLNLAAILKALHHANYVRVLLNSMLHAKATNSTVPAVGNGIQASRHCALSAWHISMQLKL